MADQITRLDDLHLAEGRQVTAERRYELALDGTTYRIDLDGPNAAEFEKALGHFLEVATPVAEVKVASSPRTQRKRNPNPIPNASRRTSKETTARIREWAENNGLMLKPKGPLPFEVKQRYADAHEVDVATLT